MAKSNNVKSYMVLHIPTSSYLFYFDATKGKFFPKIFKSKAAAGHGRDSYIFGADYRNHFLVSEADIFEYHLTNIFQYRRIIYNRKPVKIYQRAEFELVSVEE